MNQTPLTIWTNAQFADDVTQALIERVKPHRLLQATVNNPSNLASAPLDPLLAEADIAFGQPDAQQIQTLPNLQWVHLTSAGYTNYDNDTVKTALRSRGARLTTSSDVYDEPCAQHLLAMMMAFARQLPAALKVQLDDCSWPQAELRRQSQLLNGQTALLLGFGAIATRLSELLAPFSMNLIGVRRQPQGDEPIRTVALDQLSELLPTADHVINILPANESTMQFCDERFFNRCKPGALFYNIGRGGTVNQADLIAALQSNHLAATYLDVTDPEPLSPDHPLWKAPNCYITPHTAGGDEREFWHVIEHFIANLQRFTSDQPLRNQIV